MDFSNENVIHVKKDGIEYLQFRKLLEYSDNIVHAFTLGTEHDFRMPLYDAKDMILTKEQIEENKKSYKKICDGIGIKYKNIVKTNQVHKDTIKAIEKKINIDEPDFHESVYKETDGFVTNQKELALCATNADCIVLMMYDTNKKVIANVHSGWRGTIQKIAAKTIDKMQEIYNCNPKDIISCISPSIRQCHFEVDNDVKDLFDKSFMNLKEEVKENKEKWYIDTIKINIDMLKEKGLREENIVDSKICTVCNSKYIHSYRGSSHKNGLEIGLIQLL